MTRIRTPPRDFAAGPLQRTATLAFVVALHIGAASQFSLTPTERLMPEPQSGVLVIDFHPLSAGEGAAPLESSAAFQRSSTDARGAETAPTVAVAGSQHTDAPQRPQLREDEVPCEDTLREWERVEALYPELVYRAQKCRRDENDAMDADT